MRRSVSSRRTRGSRPLSAKAPPDRRSARRASGDDAEFLSWRGRRGGKLGQRSDRDRGSGPARRVSSAASRSVSEAWPVCWPGQGLDLCPQRRDDPVELSMQHLRPVFHRAQREGVCEPLCVCGARGRRGDRHDVALRDRHGADLSEHGVRGRMADTRATKAATSEVVTRLAAVEISRSGARVGDQAEADEVRFAVYGCHEQARFGLPGPGRDLRVDPGDGRGDEHAGDDQAQAFADHLDIVAQPLLGTLRRQPAGSDALSLAPGIASAPGVGGRGHGPRITHH